MPYVRGTHVIYVLGLRERPLSTVRPCFRQCDANCKLNSIVVHTLLDRAGIHRTVDCRFILSAGTENMGRVASSIGRMLPRGGAAIAIGTATAIMIGAVAYSHYQQVEERRIMRAGVERDKERLRHKRRLQLGQQQER